jgi:hypothetical protein
MSSANAGNAGTSGEASKTPRPAPKTEALDEAKYLQRESEQAKQAAKGVADEMMGLLKGGVDVKAIVGEHPWASMGTAVAAGFLIASAVTPARDESLAERLRSLMPEMPAQGQSPGPAFTAAQAMDARNRGFAGTLASHLADALKTAVVSTLTSVIAAKAAKEPEPTEGTKGNGETAG